MISLKRCLYMVCALVGASFPAAYAEKSAGDVITMNNGDIYIGQVLQQNLMLSTSFGELSIPVKSIEQLKRSSHNHHSRVSTRRGEIINGQLVSDEIRISRLQDPTLPLAIDDIANIRFNRPHQDSDPAAYPALLETQQGDRLYVQPGFETLKLDSDAGATSFELSSLRYIDSNLHGYDEQLLTQLTLDNGSHFQGSLQDTTLNLVSPYLPGLMLPLESLSRLNIKPSTAPRTEAIFSHSLRSRENGPQMIRLPGGVFLRGDYQGDGDDDEKPLAEVRLKAFAIGRYEISFDDYALYCERQSNCEWPDDQDWGRGRRPLINVSWLEAQAYVEWLAGQTGQAYRLPSDAEWEYAHRAGSTSRFPWGDEPGSARANCEACGSIWDGDKTSPSGRFEPNAFGLYDTAGNVFEWVADCFHDRFADAPKDGSPIEKEGCGKRVIRGGAWSFPPHEIRSANRWRDFPSRRSDDTGFRVALDLE